MAQRSSVAAGVVLCAAVFIVLAWRPLGAWYADDLGNLALFKGDQPSARAWFADGLRQEPHWSLLHEDMGRALLKRDPAAALNEFRVAACGPPCVAEEGDALLGLGHLNEAISRYIAAKAVVRLSARAQELAIQGRYGQAIALEQALIARLHDNFLERAELASAYASLGSLQSQAPAQQAANVLPLRHAAIRSLQVASALAPFNESYLLQYAYAQLQWGDRAAARDAFQRLLRLHPHQREAEKALAQLAAQSNRPGR